ncbi:MAG: ribosome biogenesis factor YjgA [Pseudomonadota bacterium]
MDEHEQPSKSQRKREMQALQKTGARLVELNADQLAQIGLPELLLEAILEAQRIRDFEGRRRQMQYIGKLMREVDPAPIQARLEQWHGVARAHTASQHLAERWRERLLDEENALALFANEYPGSDLQHLRSLVASIKRDKAASRPLRNYRELFRAVRHIMVKSSATE